MRKISLSLSVKNQQNLGLSLKMVNARRKLPSRPPLGRLEGPIVQVAKQKKSWKYTIHYTDLDQTASAQGLPANC